jgi:2-aminoadipate transaminase
MVQLWDAIELDRTSDLPLYQQLEEHIVAAIDDGNLPPGTKLPASRDLASKLGINRNTVTSAYEALANKDFVRSHVGQGTFVVDHGPRTGSTMRWSFSRAADAARDWVRSPAEETRHPDAIDFASMVPDEELFPVEPFRVVLDEVLAQEGKKLLQYGPATGYPPLRSYIAERLARRGVETTPDNVLVVNGSQQALDLICRTLLDPGDPVVLESPTYTIVLPLLAQYGADIEEIPMTPRGIDLDALEASLARSRPKFLFTMPTFHNPTGITTDLASRRRLVDIATTHGVPVVEDDFDSELRFRGDALPPLKALDDDDCVIHIGTFSKGLFPGLRLGWLVAPADVVDTLGRSKLISDYHTSLLLQSAVLTFCQRGHYDEHLERLAGIYREKSRSLVAALERHFPDGVTWTEPEGGFAFWITLPASESAEAVLADAATEGVVFTPGTHFFARGEGRRYLRLSISRVPVDRIEEGVARLGKVLARRLGRAGGDDGKRGGAREQEPALHI